MDDGSLLDEVFEMANLSEATTGIPGVVYISSRQGAHGPRVKYYERPGKDRPSFSVSVAETPKVVAGSLPERIVSRMSPMVIEWVKLNRAALIDFWNEGDTWFDEDVAAFKAALRKVQG